MEKEGKSHKEGTVFLNLSMRSAELMDNVITRTENTDRIIKSLTKD